MLTNPHCISGFPSARSTTVIDRHRLSLCVSLSCQPALGRRATKLLLHANFSRLSWFILTFILDSSFSLYPWLPTVLRSPESVHGQRAILQGFDITPLTAFDPQSRASSFTASDISVLSGICVSNSIRSDIIAAAYMPNVVQPLRLFNMSRTRAFVVVAAFTVGLVGAITVRLSLSIFPSPHHLILFHFHYSECRCCLGSLVFPYSTPSTP